MTVHYIANFFGTMLAINCVFFILGLLKITLFRGLTRKVMLVMFGDATDDIEAKIPQILFIYWILIIMFNLTPYLALRLF